ncbi:MAG TPA: AbrB/MazE/SpoVT family DNA-binding domain-containing protein [Pseudogracilibacillus sp.]|nr:AbrB/MazE/SpoVT family DNA-binding domain-containing protein [Pseudogracilibacillus sp.]
MNKKEIAISAKRQMTIPKEFYDKLEFGNQVICEVVDDYLVIKRKKQPHDFSEEILNDLIKEGYEAGEELVKEFSYRKEQMAQAAERMIEKERDHQTYENVEELFDEIFSKETNE